ncbi:MAG: hypothetical protein WCL51_13520 [Bacteroidota bacterium]
MTKGIDEKSRLIQKITTELGWDVDINLILDRIKQLDNGLIQEDEFIYLLNWSDRFTLIHKLEQIQIPSTAKRDYIIPDLLVIHNDNGKETPYLIEIKTSKDTKLSWSEKYYKSLINYSKKVNIPLLIAWKCNTFDIWTLFDITLFEKPNLNYKIDIEKAIKQNMLSIFAGDYIVIAYEHFSLNFKFKKITKKLVKGNEIDYSVSLESFYYIGKDNKRIESLNPSYFALIIGMFSEEVIEEDDNFINIKYIPNNTLIYIQTLILNLTKGIANSNNIKWIELAKEKKYLFEYVTFLELLKKGIKEEIFDKIMLTIPYGS